jgi:hypothetical protein
MLGCPHLNHHKFWVTHIEHSEMWETVKLIPHLTLYFSHARVPHIPSLNFWVPHIERSEMWETVKAGAPHLPSEGGPHLSHHKFWVPHIERSEMWETVKLGNASPIFQLLHDPAIRR